MKSARAILSKGYVHRNFHVSLSSVYLERVLVQGEIGTYINLKIEEENSDNRIKTPTHTNTLFQKAWGANS